MTYSSLAYKWLAAESWPRPDGAGIRAIAIHMAEGGGTAGWLTRIDGNSSHYTVEYSGKVVAQVHEERAAGSMNARLTRGTNDPVYSFLGERIIYGRTALNRCLGAFATNPNAVVIAIEVEGFENAGPNTAQRAALAKLVADIRRRRGPKPCIGHRDQQSYKDCPGKRIPWIDYGGHAVTTLGTGGLDVTPLTINDQNPLLIDVAPGNIYDLDGTTVLKTISERVNAKLSPFGVAGSKRGIYATVDGEVRVVLVNPISGSGRPVPDATPITQAAFDALKVQLEQAKAAEADARLAQAAADLALNTAAETERKRIAAAEASRITSL